MKDKNIILRVSQAEKSKIKELAAKLNLTISGLVMVGIDLIQERIDGIDHPSIKDIWYRGDTLEARLQQIELLLDRALKL